MRAALGLASAPRYSILLAFCAALVGCADGDRGTGASDDASADDADSLDGDDADAMWEDAEATDADIADAAGEGSVACAEGDGTCVDPLALDRCVREPGAGLTRVQESCVGAARCRQDGARAACELSAACQSADSPVCTDSRTIALCEQGSITHQTCEERCLSTPFGAECAAPLSTRAWQTRVSLERRAPSADMTDWDTSITTEPARGFLVLIYRGEALVDARVTSVDASDPGRVSVRIPDPPQADDSLVVMAAGADARGGLGYVVGDPGFSPSSEPHASDAPMPDAKVWSWRFPLAGLADDASLVIGQGQGSAAAWIFDSVRSVFSYAEGLFQPTQTPAVVAWVGIGVLWRCSVCTNQLPVTHFGRAFGHQIRFDGSSDEAYWSEPVNRHELGHYVMNAYGLSPKEAGPHYFGEPTNPGQAWSEGWATFFSASERGSSIYYDKQAGGFFWFDIDARHYAFDDLLWQRPVAANGLTQPLDENEVASMLWHSFELLGERASMLRALRSPRMTVPPFERGYRRRMWSDRDHPELYTETDVSVTHLADFFDAMRCTQAISAAQLDAITEPTLRYPYPSASPLCR